MRLLSVCLLLVVCTCCWSDEVTPSGTTSTAGLSSAGAATPIDFQAAERDLTAVYPLQLKQMTDVFQNSYNWSGPEDASVSCDIGFTPTAVVLRAEITDDIPFFQTLLHPAMPPWWRITYGADGLEFMLDDPTSAAQHVQFVLNFGSHAVNPQVELLTPPPGGQSGPIPTAAIRLYQASGKPDAPPDADAPISVEAAIPVAALADPRLFLGPLRITMRLHDMDGDPSTYLMMQTVVEKR